MSRGKNGGWAADAWPAHDEKKGEGERAGRSWAAPGKPTQERGGVWAGFFLFSICL
jgi:hypothetical protein